MDNIVPARCGCLKLRPEGLLFNTVVGERRIKLAVFVISQVITVKKIEHRIFKILKSFRRECGRQRALSCHFASHVGNYHRNRVLSVFDQPLASGKKRLGVRYYAYLSRCCNVNRAMRIEEKLRELMRRIEYMVFFV